MFEAGTRLFFYIDRTQGTIPSHVICVKGWFNDDDGVIDPHQIPE
jgi:hypothetical protein